MRIKIAKVLARLMLWMFPMPPGFDPRGCDMIFVREALLELEQELRLL